MTNSAFADPALGTVTAVNNALFLGQGDSAVELATLETNYNGLAQTLRVRFSDALAQGTVSDELAARVSELITFNNGSDLKDDRNVVAKRITTELFTSDLSTNLALSRDFVSSTLWMRAGSRLVIDDSWRNLLHEVSVTPPARTG